MTCARFFTISLALGALTIAVGVFAQAANPTAASDTFTVQPPKGLPPVPVPDDNPMTKAKVELGKLLYFDKRLSKDESISCATCHDPQMAWAEHKPASVGIHKQVGERNAPTVINAAYLDSQFWDGRAKTLEEQALGPIENPIEMGMEMDLALDRLAKIEGYQKRFKEVFGTGVTKDGVAKAIAAFERTVLSGNAPYDKYQAGDKSALNDSQKRGLEIFMNQGQCSTCHTPPVFSNSRFYNVGVGMDKDHPDVGLMKETKKDRDKGKFRVPHLREIAHTHPYFHDGSVEELEEAVRIMATGGKDNPNLSLMVKVIRMAELTDQDIKDLTAFLKALSGDFPKTEPPKLPS